MALNPNATERTGRQDRGPSASRKLWQTVRRAFVEFLAIPSAVIAGFVLLALVTFLIDEWRMQGASASPDEWHGLFSDAQATRDFISVIAASIITVTSITLSLLLIAVQQGASALTTQVFDQFLRRRSNQFYFGFFIGLALYSLIVLASINPAHRPTVGVALAGLLTAAALYALILLVYTTIDEMRPVVILRSIHDHTLLARQCQRELLQHTKRSPRLTGVPDAKVTAAHNGFMTRIDIASLARAAGDRAEIVVLKSIGDYVAFGDPIAEIRVASTIEDMSSLEDAVRKAAVLEEQRDLDTDPTFGVQQIAIIGWTSISTAKSNPDPGLLAIQNLRDLLARWLHDDAAFGDGGGYADPASPVVYFDDLPNILMRAFESLAVVASESMQHQNAAAIYRTFAGQFHRLPAPLRTQAEDLFLRSLAGLGDHILTSELDAALSDLCTALRARGPSACAEALDDAQQRLARSVGRLHSRGTRAAP